MNPPAHVGHSPSSCIKRLYSASAFLWQRALSELVELAPSVEPLAFLWQRALSELVELAPSVEPLAFLWQRALSQFAIEHNL
jgi:hypothetical protein